MHLSASERATLNFYQWERLGRGYYLFGEPIEVEPPYVPFVHRSYADMPSIDDGRVPTLLETGLRLLKGGKEEPRQEHDEFPELIPEPANTEVTHTGFAVYLPNETEVSSVVSAEFLNMLSFTDHPISFELVGTKEAITVQIVCASEDRGRVESHLRAYFPTAVVRKLEDTWLPFDTDEFVAIADFGMNNEFMRPIQTVKNFTIDPLTSVIATMENLQNGDTVLFQTIFKGVTAPWARDIQRSVSDGRGGSFFSDSPEMPNLASEKVSALLFAAVIRVACQSSTEERSQYLATELIRGITASSNSQANYLIPLSNEGYNYHNHLYNVLTRKTNRLGMILNTNELASFVHYPNKTVVSQKLGWQGGKTKALPEEVRGGVYEIGVNLHNAVESIVTLNDQQRLRHTHLIGATGVGKSTLITNMVLEDIRQGNGVAVFDPHGDVCDGILERIPKERLDDVILIDPFDAEYPIGFNLLSANTEAEAIVLGSDLVSSFKRQSTSWGDNINAVLSNAINTFLESDTGGTLIELKRFLIEEKFRNDFLESVDDPSIHYYWEHEYPMVRKGIAPLLTRTDTFLRPKIVRYMLAQQSGVDFRECIEQKKIVLIKLSQGLIGEENSYLLGSLFLSKFNQVAQGRQNLPKEKRHPYYLYLDEFQNFITPSITSILSGARKYGLGLILAHQELSQIDDPKTLNSVISNPYVRICFRLGDVDARKLETGFSYFEESDLQSLGIGQAIARVGSSQNDFNLATHNTPEVQPDAANSTKNAVIQNTRRRYAKQQSEVQEILDALLPKLKREQREKANERREAVRDLRVTYGEVTHEKEEKEAKEGSMITEKVKRQHKERVEASQNVREHTHLQSVIKKLGQERGFMGIVEKEVADGKIDITLEREDLKIAFEVSVTNTPKNELANIRKCLSGGYNFVVSVSKDADHRNKIEELAKSELTSEQLQQVFFLHPDEIGSFLDAISTPEQPTTEIVQGFRVTTEYEEGDSISKRNLKQHLSRLLFRKKRKS